MMKKLIQKAVLSMFFGWALIAAAYAQNKGAYGDVKYFEWKYSSVSDWTAFPGSSTYTATVDGDLLTFGGNDVLGATRNRGGYLGAVRSQSVELPEYASLGYFSFYAHNGSSGSTRNLYIKISTDNGITWSTVETIAVGGNVDDVFTIKSVLSKKPVKVKIDSDGKYFWFHQIEAWSSALASTNPSEAPTMLSSNPAGGDEIQSVGTITLQFDEIVKAGTGTITFGAATVTPVFLGSTLQLNYTGLTGSANTLTIPASFVQNIGNVSLASDISLDYTGDITDPVYESVTPAKGSNIVIRDVVEKIVLTFDEAIALGSGTITFGPATVTPTVSGNKLIIGYSGLAYEQPYELIIPANLIKDISGNTFKSEIRIDYTTLPKDNKPTLLATQSVANGETEVPIGGSIYFTFKDEENKPEIVKAGTANVTLGVNPVLNPVTLSFNESMVGINYTNLDYNTTYTVNIPAGAITDTTGNAYAGTSFTFTTKAQATKNFDFIVAADGSGDYTTINAAIAAVPDNSVQRTFIFVKSGTYNEKLVIDRQNISLIGQDPFNTIIEKGDKAQDVGGTDNSYTVKVTGTGFYAENITIRNTHTESGGSGNQAVALMTDGDRMVFKNCRFTGLQDTHYPKKENTRNYYLDCYIEGNTDFMFGGATAFYEGCTINCVAGGQYITAPSGTPKEFGLVYNNCKITANADVPNDQFYLGRPWKDNAKTVWLNTKMQDEKLKDAGWAVWTNSGDDADNHLTGFFAEFNPMNLDGAPVSPATAAWGKVLTPAQAARYTIDNAFNYGAGYDTWNPLPFSTAPAAPTNVAVVGGVVTWDAVPFAVAYILFKDGVQILTETANSKEIVIPGIYTVKAVNEYGAQSPASTGIVASIKVGNLSTIGVELYPNPFTEVITIQNSEKIKTIEFFNVDGKLVKQTNAASTVKTSGLEAGTYVLNLTDYDGIVYSTKMIKR